jgi:Ca2+-binding RTX toxin-like protein
MWIFGTNEPDTLWGTDMPDILWGFGGNDFMLGNGGNDELYGGDGYDQLYGGTGNDRLVGEDGDDYLDGETGNDLMIGGVGYDRYVVDSAGDKIIEYLGQGVDTVYASIDYALGAHLENLTLTGSAIVGFGNELGNVIHGNGSDNWLYGEAGIDHLHGGGGEDHLFGGLDGDWLYGEAGNDTMAGGSGDDHYFVTDAGDVVVENPDAGDDWVYSSVNGTTALSANVERLVLVEGAGHINGTGNELENIMAGNSQDNIFNGRGGRDIMDGGAGHDYLIGEAGNDILIGGRGQDDLSGGGDLDTFLYYEFQESLVGSEDRILDFSRADGDRLDLSRIDANAIGGTDNDAFSFIDGAAFSGAAGQLRFAGGYVEADVNGDALADLRIEMGGVTTMYATDFVL